jgi:uncharacterized protein with PIN domain
MVIDTSAIVAIALNEVDAADIERLIVDDPIRLISAATVLEATMVIETRLGDGGGSMPDKPMLHGAPGVATARDVTPRR